MIMPKNREANSVATSRLQPNRAELKEAGSRTIISGGRSSVDIKSGTVELAFTMPMDVGMAVIEQIRAGATSEESPILLWAGRDGVLSIQLRHHSPTCEPTARHPVSTIRKPEPAPARPEMECITIGDLVINPGRHEVLYKGKAIPQLTFTEFGILHFLARHPGWVFNRAQIVAGVRGEEYPVTDRAVDVQVAGLRKKLGAASECIQTVRGVGYRFRD